MSSVLDLGNNHLAAAIAGETAALRDLFDARVIGWGKTYSHEEERTVGLFSDLEQHIQPYVAFALVSETVQLVIDAQDEFERFNCALDLLASLVTATATTEIPPVLQSLFPEIERRAISFGGEPLQSVSVIRGHYRNAI